MGLATAALETRGVGGRMVGSERAGGGCIDLPDLGLLRQSPGCTKRHSTVASHRNQSRDLCAKRSILDRRAELSRGCSGGGQDARAKAVIAGTGAKSGEEEGVLLGWHVGPFFAFLIH